MSVRLTDAQITGLLSRARTIVLNAEISDNFVIQSAALSDVFKILVMQERESHYIEK